MKQESLSLFEENETTIIEDEQSVSSKDEEEIHIYSDGQKEILSFLYKIIDEGFDRGCPLGIYITKKKYYRVNYHKADSNNTNSETGYIVLAEESSVEKTLQSKRFSGLIIENYKLITENEIPKDTKPMNTQIGNLFSFELDLSLSKPKWFSILYGKKASHIQIILDEKTIQSDPEVAAALKGYEYKYTGQWCNIKTGVSQKEVMMLLRQLRPVLKNRYNFIYAHRIVDPCCCELQNKCLEEKRCVSENREMQMKCSFRKLKEREGDFTKPAKYSSR